MFQVAVGNRRYDFGDASHLSRQVSSHEIDVIGQFFPGSGGVGYFGLSAQNAFGSDFAGDCRHLIGEDRKRVNHAVDGVSQSRHFTFGFDHQFLRQIAIRDSGHDFDNASHLSRQVAGHEVDVVGQIFPCAGNALHFGLPAQLAFGSNFARYARDFCGKRIQLIHHHVDGVFQFQNFAAGRNRNFL